MKIKELYADVITEDLDYEFKAQLNSENTLKWAKSIVGFANGDGGIIFIGVANDGEVFGMDLVDIDRTKNLVYLVNDRHIFPHAKLKFQMRSIDDAAENFVLALEIERSESIVRYREGDFNDTVFVKGDGNTTAASPEEIIALHRRKHGVDNEVTDIYYNENEWKKYNFLCRNYRKDHLPASVKELQNKEIITADEFVKSGFEMFKDDYSGDETLIVCRLWKGKNKLGIVLDRESFKGSLAKVFDESLDFIERNTKTGYEKLKSGGRREVRSYPKLAIREAMVNAIAHRDYSIMGTQIDVNIYDDRIDIVSPGSWLLPKTYDEYALNEIPSIRRNGIIAACLDVAHLMERGGTGFQTIADEYKDADKDKQPAVISIPGFLELRLFDLLYENNEIEFEKVKEHSDEEIVLALLENSPKTISELQGFTSYRSRPTFLKNVINPLIEAGKIYRDGNPKSPKSVFKLKD